MKAKFETGMKGKRIILHGFGRRGSFLANMLVNDGGKIIGVIDNDGEIYNEKGIDIPELKKYKNLNHSIKGYKNFSTPITIHSKPCDIFISCLY